MKREIVTLLSLSVLLSGCTQPEAATYITPTAQKIEIAEQESVLWELPPSPSPADFCKIPDQRPEEFLGQARGHTVNGVTYGGPSGFPLVEVTVPSLGQLDWLFIMVAFKDTPRFVETPSEFMDPHIKVMEAWIDHWSQGKLEFNISYVDYWIELPMNAAQMSKDEQLIAQMIQEQLPPGISFTDFDANFIQWDNLHEAPGVTEAVLNKDIRFTLRIGSNELYYEDESDRPNLIWAPSYYHASNQGQPIEHKQNFAYGHWLHEILHEMGLNLHAPGNGWPTGVGQVLYPFNKSGDLWSAAISSWEQFLLTWLDDSQVHCIDRTSVTESKTILSALEVYGGDRKMIAIPNINEENELLVVEARSPQDWSYWHEGDEGLLVYRVDPSAKHRDHIPHECGNDPDVDKWAYYLFPDNAEVERNHCGRFSEALVMVGESLSYEGIQVNLESIIDGQFYVSINIAD
jgi:hypothetical protein